MAPSILEIVPDPMRDIPPPPEAPMMTPPLDSSPVATPPAGAVALASPVAVEVRPATPTTPADVPAAPATAAPALKPAQTAAPQPGTIRPTRVEPSIPPAGDLDVHFFDRHLVHDPLEDEVDPNAARRAMFAAAAPRRARFAKYVRGAVVASAALCVIALAKAALLHGDSAPPARAASLVEPARHAVAQAASVPPPSTAVAVAPPPDPAFAPAAPAPAAPSNAPELAVAEQPAPAAVAPPAEVAPAAEPPPPPAAEPPPPPAAEPPAVTAAPAVVAAPAAPDPLTDPAARAKEASRARETARAALERGALREAISAGERSVALDGTDGESWLILGAAYQQGGDLVSARRSYRACIDQGRRGPRSECAQMLR
jgi:hypothetical protein